MKKNKKQENISKGMKASIAFFIANTITAGIAYFTTPLFTRILTSAEYGEVSIFITWKQAFGIVAMFCLSYGVFNNGMSDFPDDRDEYSFSMLILSNIITFCFGLLLFVFYPIIYKYIGLNAILLCLMLTSFIFQPAYNFWIVRQRYEYKYRYTFVFTVLSAIISPLVSLLCIQIFTKNKVYSRLFGSEIPLIIIYIGFYIYLGIRSKWKCRTSYWKNAFLFNLPLIPHYLSTYLLSSLDKIMISLICGNSYTAYYSVAYSVASVGTIVWSAANASLVPYTYEKCKKNEYKSISDVTTPILIFYGIVCFAVIVLAPEIVSFLATKEYSDSVFAIPPVIAGLFFQVQYYMYANVIYYYKKPKYVMYASVISTIINLILNYIFLNKYGYIAAGYTTLACYLLQAIIDYFSMKAIVGQQVYNMNFVICFSILVVIVCLTSSILYTYTIVRYILIVIIGIILVISKNRIIAIFESLKKF